jgi:hypothetical protein
VRIVRARAARHVALACGLAGAACIIPDFGIRSGRIQNRAAVRIVEPFDVVPELDEACGTSPQVPCAQPPASGLPRSHFFDPSTPFCSCSVENGEFDDRRLRTVSLYVEDLDSDDQGRPADSIFAAILLDVPADTTRPASDFVEYRRYLDPTQPALNARDDYEPDGRLDPQLREIVIADANARFDLCTGPDRGPLAAGFHTLEVVVTDRPWFAPARGDADTDEDVGEAPQLVGVPDLAAGATYATTTYTFFCAARDEAPCDTQCRVGEDG